MLKIKSLRWGTEMGGMACGPVPASNLAEFGFEDAEGNAVYILVSEYDCSECIMIAAEPLFDMIAASEWETAKTIAKEMLEFDKSDREGIEEGIEGPYRNGILLTRSALKDYCAIQPEPSAAKFIEPLIDTDVDEMDIPLVNIDDDWEEDE